jgi:hypothetical protein
MADQKTARKAQNDEPAHDGATQGERLRARVGFELRPRGGAARQLQCGPRVFEALLGSWSQGLAREGSDADWKGIFVGGPGQWAEPLLAAGEERFDVHEHGVDGVFWAHWRFAELVGSGNFSALKLLWCDPTLIERSCEAVDQLRAQRDRFLSRETIDVLGGTAIGQIRAFKKIQQQEREGKTSNAIDPAAKPGKLAAHALRLARMSLEVAERGEFLIVRPDAEELLALKNGSADPEKAILEAESTARASRSVRAKAPVPEKADQEFARAWARALFQEELARRGADAAAWADTPGTALTETQKNTNTATVAPAASAALSAAEPRPVARRPGV